MKQETWDYIANMGPEWLSAIGTLAAVVVALYLARKNDRIALSIRSGLRKVGHVNRPGGKDVLLRVDVPSDSSFFPKPIEVVWVNITNVSRRSTTITLLYWRPVPWRKRGFALIPDMNRYSNELPVTLDDGKSADYCWSLTEFVSSRVTEELTEQFRDEFKGFFGATKLRLLRLCVATSTGDVFRCRPEKQLRDHIRKIAKASGT